MHTPFALCRIDPDCSPEHFETETRVHTDRPAFLSHHHATSCWSVNPPPLVPHASKPRVPRCRRSPNKPEVQSIGRTTANFTHRPTLMVTQAYTFQPLFTNVSRWRLRRMHSAGACQQAIEFTVLPFSLWSLRCVIGENGLHWSRRQGRKRTLTSFPNKVVNAEWLTVLP